MQFADVEKALTVLLEPLAGGPTHTGTETPSDLQTRLPFLRVLRYGGPRDRVTDYASIDVDAFAATRTAAFDLLIDALDLIEHSHGTDDLLIDDLQVTVGPSERPWNGSPVRRFGASIVVSARRQMSE